DDVPVTRDACTGRKGAASTRPPADTTAPEGGGGWAQAKVAKDTGGPRRGATEPTSRDSAAGSGADAHDGRGRGRATGRNSPSRTGSRKAHTDHARPAARSAAPINSAVTTTAAACAASMPGQIGRASGRERV